MSEFNPVLTRAFHRLKKAFLCKVENPDAMLEASYAICLRKEVKEEREIEVWELHLCFLSGKTVIFRFATREDADRFYNIVCRALSQSPEEAFSQLTRIQVKKKSFQFSRIADSSCQAASDDDALHIFVKMPKLLLGEMENSEEGDADEE